MKVKTEKRVGGGEPLPPRGKKGLRLLAVARTKKTIAIPSLGGAYHTTVIVVESHAKKVFPYLFVLRKKHVLRRKSGDVKIKLELQYFFL
jgi:hypothetical protein